MSPGSSPVWAWKRGNVCRDAAGEVCNIGRGRGLPESSSGRRGGGRLDAPLREVTVPGVRANFLRTEERLRRLPDTVP